MSKNHQKEIIAMRYFLIGRNYTVASKALEFAKTYHTGTRKDGITPEFAHQIFIANYAKTLEKTLLNPETVFASIFLHDICEDHDISFKTLEKTFGTDVAKTVENMTKKYNGIIIPYDVYFKRLSEDPNGSIAKGLDRIHNVLTMNSANWTPQKQISYLEEVDTYFLPMIKTARKFFPEQESCYQNIKTVLKIQSSLIRLSLKNTETQNTTQHTEIIK